MNIWTITNALTEPNNWVKYAMASIRSGVSQMVLYYSIRGSKESLYITTISKINNII